MCDIGFWRKIDVSRVCDANVLSKQRLNIYFRLMLFVTGSQKHSLSSSYILEMTVQINAPRGPGVNKPVSIQA